MLLGLATLLDRLTEFHGSDDVRGLEWISEVVW